MKESLNEELHQENNNNDKNNSKFMKLFNKYKEEDDLISKNGLNKILEEIGIENTIDQSEELIKKINKDNKNEKLNFNQFLELIESDNIINIDINEKKTLSNFQIFLIYILFIFGSFIISMANVILRKLKARDLLFESHKHLPIFCMFFSEFLCLLIYFIKGIFIKKKEEQKKNIKSFYFLILSLLNVITEFLHIFILIYLSLSIYEMFYGLLIIFTFILSILYLKAKYYKQHFLSICIIIIGISISGLYRITKINTTSSKNLILGIFLLIIRQLIISFYFNLEEKILKEYDYSSLKTVGLEGIFGTFIYTILLIIFQFISCENWSNFYKNNFCVMNDENIYHIEDSLFAFKQILENKKILLFILLYCIGVILYNSSRLIIFKNRSAMFYLIVDNIVRIFGVFIFLLVLPKEYKDENDTFSWLVLIGLVILLLGCLIFFEILVLPFWGLGDNTNQNFKKRKQLENEISLINMDIGSDKDEN